MAALRSTAPAFKGIPNDCLADIAAFLGNQKDLGSLFLVNRVLARTCCPSLTFGSGFATSYVFPLRNGNATSAAWAEGSGSPCQLRESCGKWKP